MIIMKVKIIIIVANNNNKNYDHNKISFGCNQT